MEFFAHCLHAKECDSDEWADGVSSMKKGNNANAHGRINNNSVPRMSSNLAVTAALLKR